MGALKSVHLLFCGRLQTPWVLEMCFVVVFLVLLLPSDPNGCTEECACVVLRVALALCRRLRYGAFGLCAEFVPICVWLGSERL